MDEHPKPKLFTLNRGQMFPEKMLMSDYKFDGIETWWPWLKSEEATFSDGTHITHALVPTKETNTMMYWLNLSIKISVPIVIVGDTAVGKSFTIRQFLNELPKEKFIHSVLNLAANTKPQTVQEIVMSKLDRRRKGVFGPPVGKLVSFNWWTFLLKSSLPSTAGQAHLLRRIKVFRWTLIVFKNCLDFRESFAATT